MLAKKDRLTKKDIQVFFSLKNRSVHGTIVSFRFRKNERTKNRWAVVVSSVPKKNAYHRNTTRRRIFGIIRSIQDHVSPGFDIIVSTRLSQKKSPSFEDLKGDMIRTLHICKLFH